MTPSGGGEAGAAASDKSSGGMGAGIIAGVCVGVAVLATALLLVRHQGRKRANKSAPAFVDRAGDIGMEVMPRGGWQQAQGVPDRGCVTGLPPLPLAAGGGSASDSWGEGYATAGLGEDSAAAPFENHAYETPSASGLGSSAAPSGTWDDHAYALRVGHSPAASPMPRYAEVDNIHDRSAMAAAMMFDPTCKDVSTDTTLELEAGRLYAVPRASLPDPRGPGGGRAKQISLTCAYGDYASHMEDEWL